VTSTHLEIALDSHAGLGESPVWDDRLGLLLWVDMVRGQFHRFDPGTGVDSFVPTPARIGAVALRQNGGYVAALSDGFYSVDFDTGHFDPLVRLPVDKKGSLNDGKCDDRGRFWVGSIVIPEEPVRPGDPSAFPPEGILYRLDGSQKLQILITNVRVSNGLGWSPNNEIFYYIDSATHAIDCFDYDSASGDLNHRRRFIQLADDCTPDGMAVDCEGGVWVAVQYPDGGNGTVRRFSSVGDLDDEITLPIRGVTSCAFGGDNLDILFITSHSLGPAPLSPAAGAIFCCRPGIAGLPHNAYRG
jgi:sugar lactone lactonase YvrE